jgi:hypothetical protein
MGCPLLRLHSSSCTVRRVQDRKDLARKRGATRKEAQNIEYLSLWTQYQKLRSKPKIGKEIFRASIGVGMCGVLSYSLWRQSRPLCCGCCFALHHWKLSAKSPPQTPALTTHHYKTRRHDTTRQEQNTEQNRTEQNRGVVLLQRISVCFGLLLIESCEIFALCVVVSDLPILLPLLLVWRLQRDSDNPNTHSTRLHFTTL